MITRLDRYIGRQLVVSTALVLGVLLALFLFIKFMDTLGYVGKGSFDQFSAVRYVLLSTPKQIYELFPMAVLLGVTLGLSGLAVDSELVAMRAAGISVWRIAQAALKTSLLFMLLAMAIGEGLAPITSDLAERGFAQDLNRRVRLQKDAGVWMRDGADFVHVGEVLPDLSLLNLTVHTLGPEGRLIMQRRADKAVYVQGGWKLSGYRASRFEADHVQVDRADEAVWETSISPDMLSIFAVKPDALSARHLQRYIAHLKQNAQETRRFDLAFWIKLFAPVTLAGMVLLATPFVFVQSRSAGVGGRLLVGILLGLGFYVLSRGFGYVGILYAIPPFLAVVTPLIILFTVSVLLIRRI